MKISFARRCGTGAALAVLLSRFSAQAQEVAPTSPGHWYVGGQVGLHHQVYVVDRLGFGAPAATVGGYGGYQFSPRLAVPVGLRYGRGGTPPETPTGQFNYYAQAEYITSQITVPVLARWAFAAEPRRFRLEGLAGLHLSYFNLRQRYGHRDTEPRIVTDTRAVNAFLDLGLGGRLRLSPRLDLATDLLLNFNFQRPINAYYPIAPGGAITLGMNYQLR